MQHPGDLLRYLAAWAVLVALSVLSVDPTCAANKVDLDRDWQFRADPGASGESAGWISSIPADTQSVSIPHTWNIGRLHDYFGAAWYFRSFELPPKLPGNHLELHFGATFYSARVWLNGVELGSHEGGFTAYSFDITTRLRAKNLLVVRLDNRPGVATIPGFAERGEPGARYDWWTYGGIVRDVWLTTSGPAWVRRQNIRTEHDAQEATVQDRIFLQSTFPKPTPVELVVTAYGPDNHPAASSTRSITLGAGTSDVTISLALPTPKLWDIDHPNLYRMVVQLAKPALLMTGSRKARLSFPFSDDQKSPAALLMTGSRKARLSFPLDEHTDYFGVRTFEIRDRHLLINGERVRLTGIARHEDSPWEGLAETRGTMQRDYDDMLDLHTTLTRPVHYPQNPFILDYADRHGMVLIPEIPVWQFTEAQLSDPRVLALARQQMSEMIEQAGNHPSIFAWSVANESATGTPGGIAYFRALRDLIHQVDPGRFVSFADDTFPKLEHAEQSAANDADFLMMNQYFGTWHGPAAALGPALDHVDRLFPNKMVIISEFGYPGFYAHDRLQADPIRIQTLREQLPMLAARDWIAGAIQWCYQDYKSPRNLWPGQAEGYVEHGVVDENRQRKPSYEAWKQLSSVVQLKLNWVGALDAIPTRFTANIIPNSEQDLPYRPLKDYELDWALQDEKGQSLASGQQHFDHLTIAMSVDESLPTDLGSNFRRLTVTLHTSAGVLAAQRTLEWTPQTHASLALWPQGAPGSEGKTGDEMVRLNEYSEHIVSNVHRPSITVYLPSPARATGAGIIVVPGGGHVELWMDHEGYAIGQYLAEHGIAAFIVKYRLAREKNSTYTIEGSSLPDVQRAIRLVRSRSAEWRLDPERVGVMGFSAGGELAALASSRYHAAAPSQAGTADAPDPIDRLSSRPSFQVLLYTPVPRNIQPSKDTPPALLLGGAEDQPAISQGLARLYLAFRKAGVPVELHIYDGVGHGFGLRARNQGPVAAWPQRLLDWLSERGITKSAAAAAAIAP